MKKMCKVVTFILALAMSLSLSGCGGSDAAGYWVLDQATLEGTDYSADQMKDLGLDVTTTYIVLEKGGKGYISMWGDEEELTWNSTAITMEGDSQGYSISGDEMTLEDENTKLVFKKNAGTPPAKGAAGSGSEDTEDTDASE